jgi:hypothetical protein
VRWWHSRRGRGRRFLLWSRAAGVHASRGHVNRIGTSFPFIIVPFPNSLGHGFGSGYLLRGMPPCSEPPPRAFGARQPIITSITNAHAAGERIERYDIAIAGRRHRREAEIGRNDPHQPILHRQRAKIENNSASNFSTFGALQALCSMLLLPRCRTTSNSRRAPRIDPIVEQVVRPGIGHGDGRFAGFSAT